MPIENYTDNNGKDSLNQPENNSTSSEYLKKEKEEIAASVYGIIGNPVDMWAVAATLESLGWRDIDAKEQFGVENIFRLADEIFALCKWEALHDLQGSENTEHPENFKKNLKRFFKQYSKGTLFALPMVGQIAAILFLRYSLWAYMDFTEAQATVVAIGTILSFIVTGGFIQAVSREGIYYMSRYEFLLAKRICYKIIRFGSLAVVSIGALVYGINLLIPFYPQKMILITLGYFLLLSFLWLFLSILYASECFVRIILTTILGILPVYLVMEFTEWGIHIAHLLGMSLAIALAFLFGLTFFNKKIKKSVTALNTTYLPRSSMIGYIVSITFFNGLFYFLFLFMDRIVSWSAASGEPLPYIIWFRTPYELGMDWALLSLILTIATLEFTIHKFSDMLIPTQKYYIGFEFAEHNKHFKTFFIRQFVLLLIVGVFSILFTYFGITWLGQKYYHIKEIQEFFSNPITYFTFFAAAVGYLFISMGMFNGLFFSTLFRPDFIYRTIVPAILINLIIGLLLSRWISFEYGVIGLVAGSLVFAILSMKYSWHFFKELDYYYYSAY